jgi:hypothetical protein
MNMDMVIGGLLVVGILVLVVVVILLVVVIGYKDISNRIKEYR